MFYLFIHKKKNLISSCSPSLSKLTQRLVSEAYPSFLLPFTLSAPVPNFSCIQEDKAHGGISIHTLYMDSVLYISPATLMWPARNKQTEHTKPLTKRVFILSALPDLYFTKPYRGPIQHKGLPSTELCHPLHYHAEQRGGKRPCFCSIHPG